jgi:alkaline phosphatase/alkaline phosphatase D
LRTSDAAWKLIITPTPMVGPDDARKTDNHVNLDGFRHEADQFFAWLHDTGIRNVALFCGDRHWQYHSIHPTGVPEFACGALNRENSRLGRKPGDPGSTDPGALIKQPFTAPEPNGGFLRVIVGADARLKVEFINEGGEVLYVHEANPAR